jgi:glycerol-3-phosphate dehydrogenase
LPMDHLAPHRRRALLDRYGTRAGLVARIAGERPELAESLAPGASAIGAEVIYAVRNEFARTISDFIIRRTSMAWRAPAVARTSASAVARLMAQELSWSLERQRRELMAFTAVMHGGDLIWSDANSRDSFNRLGHSD